MDDKVEVKIRAWDKEKRLMFYGVVKSYVEKDGEMNRAKVIYPDWYASLSKGSVVMRCVGMVDKNNKDIYEEDILNLSHQNIQGCVVGPDTMHLLKHMKPRDMEITGSTYETMKALKEGE